MKKLLSLLMVLGLFSLSSVASASITCPVDVDTYLVPMGGCGFGYPINYMVKSMEDWLTIPALTKFDLTNLADYSGDDVISANFRFYRLDSDGGPMSPDTAPAGVNLTATIHALDDTVPLTEDLLAGEDPDDCGAHGVIDLRCNRPGIFGPAYAVSNDTGPGTWAEADITQIVKDWLDGTYVNNGIEFQDDTGPAPDNYVWYWAARYESVGSSCVHLHPGAEYSPYLEVSVVPEPGSLLLLGTGLLGLLGFSRGRRRV